ncbi:MAG: hypothetical protein JW874_15295 [Spirochaetales bacterium]|nr:hypothetical protein [Spirochaetales bacterium]
MTRKLLLFFICLLVSAPLFARSHVFVFPIVYPEMSTENNDSFNNEIGQYFRKEADLDCRIIRYVLTNHPGSWDEFRNIVQDIELYKLYPDFSKAVAEGGWAAGFLLQNRTITEHENRFYSELTISCAVVDLTHKKLYPSFSFVASGASSESVDKADNQAICNIPAQLHSRLLRNGFYDRGEFDYALTGRIWVYKNGNLKLSQGDECLIQPRGYGQVLSTSGDYYKIWVSQKPALPQQGGTLKPYIDSWFEVNAGVSAFYEVTEEDFGYEASLELQFRKKFMYFRPLAGVGYLFYDYADNPLILYGGFAYSRLLGRMRIDLSYALCAAMRFDPNFTVSHTGSKFAVHAAVPLFSFLRIELEAGMLILKEEASLSVNGILAGASLVFQ